MKGRKWIEALLGKIVVSWMREAYRDEIERAINNIKPTGGDRRYRRKWYRAAACLGWRVIARRVIRGYGRTLRWGR